MTSGTMVLIAVTMYVMMVVSFATCDMIKPSEEEKQACRAKASEGSSISEDTKTKAMALMEKAAEEFVTRKRADKNLGTCDKGKEFFDAKVDADESITEKEGAKKFLQDYHRCLLKTFFTKKLANCPAANTANSGKLSDDEMFDIMDIAMKLYRETKELPSDEAFQAKVVEKFGEEKAKVAVEVRKAMLACWKEQKKGGGGD